MQSRLCLGFTLYEVLIAWSLFIVGCLACSLGQMKAMRSLHDMIIHETVEHQLHNILLVVQVDKSSVSISRWQHETYQLLPSANAQVDCHLGQCCAEIQLPHLFPYRRCESGSQ